MFKTLTTHQGFAPDRRGPSPSDTAGGPPPGRRLLWALGLLALVRLVSLACYPLMDTTEARYADIARRMAASGDWVTLWFDNGQPFWGKPPLSFWVTTMGFKLLGVHELAARLPHWLLGACVAALAWQHARPASRRAAWHGVALLSGSALFLVSSGAVMTDMALTLGTTLVMVGFWRSVQATAAPRGAAWQMVLGVSIGLLAKGPVALILCALPIGVWVALTGQIHLVRQRVAWLRDTALVLALSLPWYLSAEASTPGLLQYFIVGEHWNRFVTPGWAGDLYGTAHEFPRGTIWLFALGAAMPWPLLLALAGPGMRPATTPLGSQAGDRHAAYLWAWALTPCVFFTAAGNVIWTYVLPGLPALAVLGGLWTSTRSNTARAEAVLTLGLALCTATVLLLLWSSHASGRMERKSTRTLIADYQARARLHEPLLVLGKVPFSASFYSGGAARTLPDLAQWPAGQAAFLLLDQAALEGLAPELRLRLTPVVRRGGRVLATLQ